MSNGYTHYKDVDQQQLQIDIDAIKETIGDATQKDFEHLLKLELWGRICTFTGFAFIVVVVLTGLSGFWFWVDALIAAALIGIGNVGRWANVTHPILHGAYDKVPNIPYRYTKAGYAKGARRYIDWLDWITPDAWAFEHNIMHHYHLGELDDPDNVERNLTWLHDAKIPMFAKYMTVYAFAFLWKLLYYAPNTLRILENKERKKQKLEPTTEYQISPFKKNGLTLWKHYILPYGLFQFILLPSLFFLLAGWEGAVSALIILIMAEIVANLHSFLVIVPNHSAEDIYQFSTPHKTQGEYYLRQIMGSVNYNTGSDFIDFLHGFLNYQVEHHLFPDKPHSFYQKMQPIVKDICKKHNLEYRQDSVFKRI
ncbi:MAG: fatty acid desaturase, partial [Campylobacterota bacterium]|nr:fatty acid desaturase [Campylobacterota bacterium]